VLCDDVCVISFDETGARSPGRASRLKLWGDAAQAFGHDSATLDRAIEGSTSTTFRSPARSARPVPFRRSMSSPEPGMAKRRDLAAAGAAAMAAVMEQTYRAPTSVRWGSGAELSPMRGLARQIEVYEARRDWGYDVFEPRGDAAREHILKRLKRRRARRIGSQGRRKPRTRTDDCNPRDPQLGVAGANAGEHSVEDIANERRLRARTP
jgi:hypothetical protein